MDPDAVLWEMRALLAAYGAPNAGEVPQEQAARADRIAELAEDLDGWLTHGGHLPGPWRRARPSGMHRTCRGVDG